MPFADEPFVPDVAVLPFAETPFVIEGAVPLGVRVTGFAPGVFAGRSSVTPGSSARTGFCPGLGARAFCVAATCSRLAVSSKSMRL